MLTSQNFALIYRLFRIYSSALDWLFPPRCAGCGASGHHWCPDCQGSVKRLVEPLCKSCGKPQTFQGICPRCESRPPSYEVARAWGEFHGSLRNVVLHLKYRHDLGLGDVLARQLVFLLGDLGWEADMVVSVPLAKDRRMERGFNQVDAFSRPLAWMLEIPHADTALWRTRPTASQVGLSISERQANVKGAFRARPEHVAGKRILLMDDVMTTGATLASCAQALKTAGALEVYALTLARAIENVPPA